MVLQGKENNWNHFKELEGLADKVVCRDTGNFRFHLLQGIYGVYSGYRHMRV
jgi:hypothetical protein